MKTTKSKNTAGVTVEAPLPDYYELFGVSPSATHDEIRKAYIKLALVLHPDRIRLKGRVVTAVDSLDQFKEITYAKAILLDAKRRAAYDKERDLLMDDCPKCRGKGTVAKQQGFTRRISMHCPACGGRGKLVRHRR